MRRRRSTSTPQAKKTKERSEEKARQTARPVSPTWEDIDEERPRRKSRADPAQRANTSTRRIKTISSSQLGTVREESTGVAQDSLRFFPKLSRILENKEAAPPRRRSSGSVTSSSERSLHSIRANRSDSFDSREVAERRASRHKRRAHQRRAELLMNPSMLSVVSGTTNSSGTSSGSGSTITQKSYDKSANERRRSGEHSRHPRSRRERSSSPSGTRSSNKPSMDRSNVFAYMVPDVPGENIEGYQASSSSSAYAGSDAGSSHTPATSVTSSSPSPTMNRRRFVGDRWSVPEKAASDGNASARGSSSERSQRSRHDQRLSSTRDISEPEQYDPKKSELRKDTDTSAPTEDIPYDERADYLGHQYDEALRHQRLHDQAAVQAYYQQLESYPRYPIPRVHDEYGDAATGYYNAPPPVPEAPSHRPPMTSSYQHHTPDHPARFHKTRHIPAPADPHKVTVVGYEALAVKLSSTDQSDADGELRPIYRKFEHLNHRVLLHLQDEISELEEDLRKLDECIAQASAKAAGKGKSLPASRRAEAKAGTEAHHRRIEVLGKIYVKIGQYSKATHSTQERLLSYSRRKQIKRSHPTSPCSSQPHLHIHPTLKPTKPGSRSTNLSWSPKRAFSDHQAIYSRSPRAHAEQLLHVR